MRPVPRLMPALVTPFTAAGDVDGAAHNHNVALLWERGVRGVVIGGSNGEGPYLESGERRLLTAAARQTVPDAFVMAGVAAESLRTALAMADEAADAGADALLVMTPTTLVRHRPDLVEAFFSDVAGAAALPVFLYSVPRVTAFDLPVESVARLAAHPNVVGIKDSSGDTARCRQIVASTPAGFLTLCGASAAVADSVAGGAHGAVTASVNYAPALVAAVIAAVDTPDVAEPQAALSALSRAVEHHGVAGVKYAAGRTGLRSGHPRRPLRPLGSEPAATIDEALAAAGLLVAPEGA